MLLLASLPLVTRSARANTYYVVNKTNDSGAGSLRQAIIDANNNPGPDTIGFNIPQSDSGYSSSDGVWTIKPSSLLPSLTGGATIIDGATQTANQGDTNVVGPEVEIDGSNLGANAWIFSVESNANQILGLAINWADGAGIKLISGASGNIIKDCYIGVDPDGWSPGRNGTGIEISGGANGNVIAHNVISHNDRDGIFIDGSGTDDNMIRRNYIGLDYLGTGDAPNGRHGILIMNGPVSTIVGGFGYRNYIGGNTMHGVYITGSGTAGNSVVDNYIGIDATGTGFQAVGNGYSGIAIDGGAKGTWIRENVISGNHQHGVFISGSGTDNNDVVMNIIGANAQVTGLVPNHLHGVAIYSGAQHNQVTTENIIVGSGWSGVAIVNSDHNVVDWKNAIGTNEAGTATNLGNAFYGVHVVNGSHNTIKRGNTIAYNGTHVTSAGVRVDGASATFNTITQSSIHDNSGKGIELANGGNAGLSTPTISQASCQGPVEGSACAGCTIEVFSDAADEGRVYAGTTTAHSILPSFSWSGTVSGPNVTVTATDSQGNTSEFSAPFNVGTCNPVYLPIVLRQYP